MTDELLALAARVEGAVGADRELDGRIHEMLGNCLHDMRVTRVEVEPGEYDLASKCSKCGAWKDAAPLKFTASLDAAMTLVPEEMRLMLCEWDDEKHLRARGPWQAVVSKPGADASFDMMRGYRCEHAATPALALTAAALRARAAA